MVSAMVFQFVKRFWRLQQMEDWHLHQWRQAKLILMTQCKFPPVIANFTLPALDYLRPCAYVEANGVVPGPPVLETHTPLNFTPAFANPLPPRNDEGEDWE